MILETFSWIVLRCFKTFCLMVLKCFLIMKIIIHLVFWVRKVSFAFKILPNCAQISKNFMVLSVIFYCQRLHNVKYLTSNNLCQIMEIFCIDVRKAIFASRIRHLNLQLIKIGLITFLSKKSYKTTFYQYMCNARWIAVSWC